MNVYEMVIAIVVVVTIGGILRARYGVGQDKDGNEFRATGDTERENAALRDELARIKERVAVLERLATDTDTSVRLDREIERLRDPK